MNRVYGIARGVITVIALCLILALDPFPGSTDAAAKGNKLQPPFGAPPPPISAQVKNAPVPCGINRAVDCDRPWKPAITEFNTEKFDAAENALKAKEVLGQPIIPGPVVPDPIDISDLTTTPGGGPPPVGAFGPGTPTGITGGPYIPGTWQNPPGTKPPDGPSPVPEPGTLALIASGVGVLAARMKSKLKSGEKCLHTTG